MVFGKDFSRDYGNVSLGKLKISGANTFFNKSFQDITRDKQSGHSVFDSLFSKSVTQDDIDRIKKFNDLRNNGVSIGKAWNSTMKGATVAGKQAAVALKSGSISMKELEKSAQGAQKKTSLLTSALNIAVSVGISIAISKIVDVVTKYINRFDELSERTHNMVSEFSDAQKTIESHKSTINEISGRYVELSYGVDALGKNVSLTNSEYEEYNNICNRIAEMYPSLIAGHTEEGNAILTLKGNVDALTDAYKEEQKAAYNAVLNQSGDIDKAFEKLEKNANGESVGFKQRWERVKAYFTDGMEVEKITYDLFKDFLSDTSYAKEISGELSLWQQSLIKSTLEGMNIDIDDYDGDTFADKIASILQDPKASNRIKAALEQFESEFDSEMQSMRDYILSDFNKSLLDSNSTASKLSNEMQAVVQSIFNNLDYETLKKNNIHSTLDLKTWADNLIKSFSKIDKTHIKAFLDIQTRYNNSEISIQEYDDAVKELYKSLDSLGDGNRKEVEIALGVVDKDGNPIYATDFQRANKIINKTVEEIGGSTSEVNEWLRTLSKEEIESVLKIDTDTANWDLERWKEEVKSGVIINAALDFDVKSTTENFESLQKAIQESLSNNTGISSESKESLISIFGNDAELFDRTSTGIRLNTDRLKELQREQGKIKQQQFSDALEELYKQYNELSDKIKLCGDTTSDEYQQLAESRNAVVDKINSVSDLKSEYDGLISAYTEWQNALSNGEEGDMYDNIRSEYEKAKELFDKGLVGTSEFESYMKLLTGDDWSAASYEEITKAWRSLDNEIKKTGYSIKDFLAEDEQGVTNFLKAASKIKGSGITEKNGFFSVDVDDTEKLAEKLHVSTEFVESMFKKLKDYKFDVDFKSDTEELEKLTTGAQVASEKLRELGLTKVNFDFNTTDTGKLTDQITEAKKLYDGLKGEDGKINMNAEGAEEIVMVYERLLYQKHQLESPIIMDVDISKVSDRKLAKDIDALKKIVSLHNKIEVQAELGKDTSKLDAELSKQIQAVGKDNQILVGMDVNEKTTYEDIKNKIDEWSKDGKNAEILLNAGIDSTRLTDEADKIREYIQSAVDGVEIKLEFDNKYLNNLFGGTIKLNADTSEADSAINNTEQNVDNLKQKVETPASVRLGVDKTPAEQAFLSVDKQKKKTSSPVQVPVEADVGKATSGLTLVEGLKTQVGQPVTTTVSADTSSATSRLNSILAKLKNIAKDWLAKLGASGARGTTHRGQGLARASGDYGARRTETALIGEIAPELWVHANEGTWELVENPQFRKVKKGDIIFDGSQTAELLKNGVIDSYGRAFLSGTAYAGVVGGGTLPTKSTSKTNTTKTQASNTTQTSGNVKKQATETKSVFDKFKEWLAKLFDWVEIKIDRQAAKIDKYISKAEIYVNRATSKSYDKASNNYVSAIIATATQVQNQNNAAQIYRAQANKILSSAKSNGLINTKTMNNIISGVENGKLVISEYSEKLQEIIKQYKTWVDKSKDASKAIVDLQSKLIGYVKTLKDIRDSQRELTIDKNSFKTSVASSTFTSSSGGYYEVANGQLKYERDVLSSDYGAYKTAVTKVNSDLLGIRSYSTNTKGTGVIDKLLSKKNAKKLNKSVKKALQNTKAAMNAKKRVSDADMKVIQGYSLSLYEKVYSYNLALDNLDLARQEQALNFAEASAEIYEKIAESYENIRNAKQNSIDINKQKSENETSASSKNSLLRSNIGIYSEMLVNDAAEVQRYSDLVSEHKTKLSNKSASYRAYAYNNLSKQGKANVDNLINQIKIQVSKGHGIQATLLAKAADYYSHGYITQAFYESCIAYNNALEHKREAIAQQEINKATIEAEKEAIGTEMLENIEQEYTNKLDTNQRVTQGIESARSLIEAKRGDIDEDTYKKLITQSKEREGIYSEEIASLRAQITENLSTGIWDESSQAYQDALQKISDYEKDLVDCQINQEELKVSLRDDVYWRTFERAHDAAKRLSDVLSGINNLISDDMLYDSQGKMTEFGLAQLSTLTKQYDAARKNVDNYISDIKNLNDLYAKGEYTQLEYTEKLGELEEALLSESSTVKSLIGDILNFYKTLEQKELDGLNKIIDARKKALNAKKEYYDYDKTLKSKNKDIQFLRAQLSALEGIEDMSARAKRAQLQAQLTEAEDELNDIVQQHQFDLSSQALDGLKETMQQAFDDRWNDINSDLDAILELLKNSNMIVASQSSAIAESISKVLSFYGIGSEAQTLLNTTIANGGYATGVKNINRSETAWTQEGGKREFIIRKSDGAILTPLRSGDSVIPNKFTENLFGWGKISPDILSSYLGSSRPSLNTKQPTVNIDAHYDALLNIEGNVDSTVVTDVKKFAQQFYEGAYEYTKKEIVRDARKLGI